MALTDIEKKLIQKMLADGKTKEEIPGLLDKARAKLGLSGGSSMERASSMAQVAPTPTQATVEKAGLIKENMPEINQDIGEDSARKEMMGKAMTPGFLKPLPGIAQGLVKAAAGGASLYEKGLQKVTGITPEYAGGAETAGEVVKESKALEADTTEEKVGQFIGEYVVPAAAGGIAGSGLKVLGGSKMAQGLLGFLGSSAGGTAGYTVAGKGELPTAKELAAGAAIDAATLGTLKLLPKLAGGAKNVFSKAYATYKNKGASEMTMETLDQLKKSTPEAQDIMSRLVGQEEAYMKDKINNPSTLKTTGQGIFKDFTEKLLPAKKKVGQELASEIESIATVQSKDDLTKAFNDALESIGVKPQLVENGVNLSRLPDEQIPDFLAASSKKDFALESGAEGVQEFSKGFSKFKKAMPGLDALDLPSALKKAESLYSKAPNKTLEEFLNKFGRFDETYQQVFDAGKYTADDAYNLIKDTAFNVKTSGALRSGTPARYVLSDDSFKDSAIRFTSDDQKALVKVYNSLMDLDNTITAADQWSLSRALGTLLDYNTKLASQATSTGEVPLIALKKQLTENIKTALESEGKNLGLFAKYAKYSDAIDSLNARLGEGGEGGFSILKALQGEQRFGQEVAKALNVMKEVTGQDYVQQVKMALAAADIAGNEQVKSLLSTTSGKGAIMDVIKEGFLDKKLLLKQLKEEAPDLKQEVLEKAVAALAKALGLQLVAGE